MKSIVTTAQHSTQRQAGPSRQERCGWTACSGSKRFLLLASLAFVLIQWAFLGLLAPSTRGMHPSLSPALLMVCCGAGQSPLEHVDSVSFGAGQQLKQHIATSTSLSSLKALSSVMDMASMTPPPMSPTASTTSSSSMGSGSEDMMMMQMYFYATTKATLWFHSWSTSTRGE